MTLPPETASQRLQREFANLPSERLRRQMDELARNTGLISTAKELHRGLARSSLPSAIETARKISASYDTLGVGRIAGSARFSATQEAALRIAEQVNQLVGTPQWKTYQQTATAFAANETFKRVAAQTEQLSKLASSLTMPLSVITQYQNQAHSIAQSVSNIIGTQTVSDAFAQRMSAFAEALAEDERVANNEEMRSSVSGFIEAVKANSENPSIYDIFGLLVNLVTIIALLLSSPDFTEIDKATLEETRNASVELLAQAQAEIEIRERIGVLPKAIVRHRGNVRNTPNQAGARIAVLPRDTAVAVEEKKGNWVRIYYVDMTGEFLSGWIWKGSLEMVMEEE